MKTDWNNTTIGNVCDIVNGGTPKTGVAAFWDGEHQWITPAEMGKLPSPFIAKTSRTLTDEGLANSSAKLLPPFSVILSSRAPIGHLVINTAHMSTNQGCKGLVPTGRIHHKYLYYYLLSNVPLLNELGSGTTFKELSGSKLREVPVPLPPLPEQERIVSILDEAFSGIARAREIAEKNLASAKEVFDGLLQKLFTALYSKGELTQLSELAEDITDGDHMPPPKAATGLPFITISNIDKFSHEIDFSDTFLVPLNYYDSLKLNRRPKKGDVLYTVTGSYGIPVLVKDETKFCFQRHIGLIRPKANLDPRFLYYWIRSPQAKEQADETATGTAQKTVSLRSLRNFVLPIVPFKEQAMLISQLDETLARTRELGSIYRKKLSNLAELKKSLLHQAFTGALTGAAL